MKENYCTHSSLNIFQNYPVDNSLESGEWVYYEVNKLSNEQTDMNIDIELDKNQYLDLSNTMLCIKGQIVKKNGSNLTSFNPETDKVAPVNNFLSSLIKQVKIKIGAVEIENTNSNFAYKAYLTDLYNNNHETKSTFLGTSMFIKDTAKKMDLIETERSVSVKGQTTEIPSANTTAQPIKITLPDTVTINNFNSGFMERRQMIIDSNGYFELMGSFHSDFFNTERFLLPMTKVSVNFIKNEPKFYLMGPVGHSCIAIFEYVKLRVRVQHVNPQISIAHDNLLNKNNAIYPIKRTIVQNTDVDASTRTVKIQLNDGVLPSKLIFGLCDKNASDGTENLNPFNFRHYNLSEFDLRVSGTEFPYKKLKFDFSKKLYTEAYMSYFDSNPSKQDSGHNISYSDYPNGYATYHINLNSAINGCDSEVNFPIKRGKLTLELTFLESTNEKINGIWLMEFNDKIEIDNLRQGVKE